MAPPQEVAGEAVSRHRQAAVLILDGSVVPALLFEEEQLQGVKDERLPLRWYREVVDIRHESDLLRRLSF